MGVNNRTPIVTNGLVMYLDAGNRNSYTSGSNTWRDVSLNNNNGTLINGPGFNSANGGSIVFNGTNYVSGGLPTLSSWTMSMWYLANDISSQVIYYPFSATLTSGIGFGGTYDVTTINRWFFYDGASAAGFSNLNTSVVINTWYNVVVTKSSTVYNLYTNGSLSLNTSGANLSLNLYSLGRRGDGLAQVVGRVSQASIHNRELSASEVLQNYNAQKTRFNLI